MYQQSLRKRREKFKNLILKKEMSCICKCLINDMTIGGPKDRLTSDAVLKHPYFWDSNRTMEFLDKVNKYGTDDDVDANRKKNLKNSAKDKIFANKTWFEMIAQVEIIQEINECYKNNCEMKLDESSFFDLIRFMILLVRN